MQINIIKNIRLFCHKTSSTLNTSLLYISRGLLSQLVCPLTDSDHQHLYSVSTKVTLWCRNCGWIYARWWKCCGASTKTPFISLLNNISVCSKLSTTSNNNKLYYSSWEKFERSGSNLETYTDLWPLNWRWKRNAHCLLMYTTFSHDPRVHGV